MKQHNCGRRYDAQFKHHAVQLLLTSGKSLHSVAQGLGISDGVLKVWKGEHLSRSDGKEVVTHQLEIENQRLRRELERVSLQRDILKPENRRLGHRRPPQKLPSKRSAQPGPGSTPPKPRPAPPFRSRNPVCQF